MNVDPARGTTNTLNPGFSGLFFARKPPGGPGVDSPGLGCPGVSQRVVQCLPPREKPPANLAA